MTTHRITVSAPLSARVKSAKHHGVFHMVSRMEGWLARHYDAMAARAERKESEALLSSLDDRMMADIGYGPEDSQRLRLG
ncbi:DUF1127 domain-containing protein [Pararhodospirillum photometricum]|uniref:DUF1127 domain-containing protein n=1 Tax=Pararhodospirillum photometricum DSM 122 TaxID=1150469 RepID=H6SIX1_PARPM|nr:DUF1127 domain-containing protein [Pararhodospirillum photometricum]CCG07936.1 Putative uncharacterized protein [Pararhodospirillum photometricum DSM 122]